MRALLRAGSFFARNRAPRTAALVALGLALLLPRALVLDRSGAAAEGFRDGLAAGAGPGGALLAGLWGIFLLGGSLLLWQGVVSGSLAAGRHRTPLARPVWRPGYYLARHAAALLLLAAAAVFAGMSVWAAGGNAAARPAGLLAAALLTGWALGGLLLLLSSLLDRGDALAGAALFLAPAAADGLVPAGGPVYGLFDALLPPVFALRDVRHALLGGGPVEPGDVGMILAYGAAAVALALLRLRTREFSAA